MRSMPQRHTTSLMKNMHKSIAAAAAVAIVYDREIIGKINMSVQSDGVKSTRICNISHAEQRTKTQTNQLAIESTKMRVRIADRVLLRIVL